MREIKHKINIYLQIAIGRARFLRNRDQDTRGYVEQTIRILVDEMEELEWKDELPESMNGMFQLENNEFIDLDSVRYPRKVQAIRKASYAELEEMTEEDIENTKKAHAYEAANPYSREKMKRYLDLLMKGKKTISSDELPMDSHRDLLSSLSAVAYGEENGFKIEVEDGYTETQQMLIRRFRVEKEMDK